MEDIGALPAKLYTLYYVQYNSGNQDMVILVPTKVDAENILWTLQSIFKKLGTKLGSAVYPHIQKALYLHAAEELYNIVNGTTIKYEEFIEKSRQLHKLKCNRSDSDECDEYTNHVLAICREKSIYFWNVT
jgi:hypothetical protein